MKRFLSIAFFLALGLQASAQVQALPALTFTWPKVTTTGQVGSSLQFSNSNAPRPGTYTIDFAVTGTVPTACTVTPQGSSDLVNWFPLVTTPAACTATGSIFVTGEPVLYLRINANTYTAGDGTTSVIFHYTGQGTR